MFELRWIVPEGTTTRGKILQYRIKITRPVKDDVPYISDWENVPTIIIPDVEFNTQYNKR